jgi:hypothetical protein
MKYYDENRTKIIEFRRKHVIQTMVNGKRKFIMGVIKRPFPKDMKCEICGEIVKKLSYHHWDDDNASRGIWSCYFCHYGCNFYERRDLKEKYKELKKYINKNYNPDISKAPVGIGKRKNKSKERSVRRVYQNQIKEKENRDAV